MSAFRALHVWPLPSFDFTWWLISHCLVCNWYLAQTCRVYVVSWVKTKPNSHQVVESTLFRLAGVVAHSPGFCCAQTNRENELAAGQKNKDMKMTFATMTRQNWPCLQMHKKRPWTYRNLVIIIDRYWGLGLNKTDVNNETIATYLLHESICSVITFNRQ